jgi:hypothetical protein
MMTCISCRKSRPEGHFTTNLLSSPLCDTCYNVVVRGAPVVDAAIKPDAPLVRKLLAIREGAFDYITAFRFAVNKYHDKERGAYDRR